MIVYGVRIVIICLFYLRFQSAVNYCEHDVDVLTSGERYRNHCRAGVLLSNKFPNVVRECHTRVYCYRSVSTKEDKCGKVTMKICTRKYIIYLMINIILYDRSDVAYRP